MSIHAIPVIKINEVLVHPNADALEIIRINDYQCIVRKGQFSVGSLAAYIEPDYLVPTSEPEFEFLVDKAKSDGYARISAIRLRHERSYGLLISARPHWNEGDDVLEELKIKRYEPEMYEPGISFGYSHDAPAPPVVSVKYDMENYRKYNNVFQPGEIVEVSEKINGSNARFIFIPEDFSANVTAFLTEATVSFGLTTYPCLTPKVSLSPMPIILGFFSPLKNSPTTILVVEDPTSIPTEIFLIIFFFCSFHCTTMFKTFQMKHPVDN